MNEPDVISAEASVETASQETPENQLKFLKDYAKLCGLFLYTIKPNPLHQKNVGKISKDFFDPCVGLELPKGTSTFGTSLTL